MFKNTKYKRNSKRIENLVAVGTMLPKQVGKIKFIRGNNDKLKEFLDMGITLETEITLVNSTPLNGPVKVLVDGQEMMLDKRNVKQFIRRTKLIL